MQNIRIDNKPLPVRFASVVSVSSTRFAPAARPDGIFTNVQDTRYQDITRGIHSNAKIKPVKNAKISWLARLAITMIKKLAICSNERAGWIRRLLCGAYSRPQEPVLAKP
jgi:hypothetical protein